MATPASPAVSIVVVNWNRRTLLEACLGSLAAQSTLDFELVLVDNGSTDGSLEALARVALPATTVIRNPVNYGYTRGVNQGILGARGRFLALVNNDVVLDPRWLEEMLGGFADPEVGLCAGKILFADAPGTIDKAGHLLYADGQNYGRGHGEPDRGQYDRVEEVLFPDGAAALYRREVFESAGLFDEDFFAYGDDADLGLRARLTGWKCLYIPAARAWHQHSATLGPYSPEKIFLVERNRIWVAAKLLPWSQLLLLPFHSGKRYLFSFWALLTGRGDVGRSARASSAGALLWAVLRAQASAALGLARMLGKRRAIRQRRRISPREFARLLRQHSISARRLTLGS